MDGWLDLPRAWICQKKKRNLSGRAFMNQEKITQLAQVLPLPASESGIHPL